MRLSAQESFDLGAQYMEREKYQRAREHFVHAFEVEPNSRLGREALLLAADAYYLQGGTDNYIKCEARYRDFLNRFPTSDRADYAQFKVGACLAARAERPDRDQTITQDAIDSYQELLRLYPTSDHVAEARQQIRELTDRLAAHELIVGAFYNRYAGRGICIAAINRLEYLQEQYPEFSGMDEVLYNLAVAYERCERSSDADEAVAALERQYPESEWLEELPEWREEAAELRAERAAKLVEAAVDAAEAEKDGAGEDDEATTEDGTADDSEDAEG